MKVIIVFALFVAGLVSLHGCGGSTDDPAATICHHTQTEKLVCPGHGNKKVVFAMFNDLGNADAKQVMFVGNVMNISTSTWSAFAILDESTCRGSVDFNVPANPNPPPRPLTAIVSSSLAVEEDCKSPWKYVISFSDPGGSPGFLVNQWVQADSTESIVESTNISCPTQLAGVFTGNSRSLGSGEKQVTIEGGLLTIKPGASSENVWTVQAVINASSCSASIDFNVDGKPGQGSPPLHVQIRLSVPAGWTVQDAKVRPSYHMMFSDPAEKVRSGPLMQWVQVLPLVSAV